MKPLLERKIDLKIPLVIKKKFEIQFCFRGFHFFQECWEPKLGAILNASNDNESLSLIRDRYAIVCKEKYMIGMQLSVKIK